jgi:uncharacterized protein
MLIEFRASSIHGTGGFAMASIPAGARVIEYSGEKINKRESNERCARGNRFIFFLDAEFDLDGSVETNAAKWLNHSCEPNCEAKLVDRQIWITAKRGINAGEEITFDYGYDLEGFRDHPCHCGAPNCAGHILAEEFRRSPEKA